MNIKNTLSLTVSEAVELLSKIADSLEQKREFAFDLRGQEVSIEVGEQMLAQMSISPDEFSIVFNWQEGGEDDMENWRARFDEDVGQGGLTVPKEQSHEPPKMVREVNLPGEDDKPVRTTESSPETVVKIVRRALPERMKLNTSTLPLESGYWSSAFTDNGDVQWSPLEIESELENKKWAGDDQITSLADITPAKAKPKTQRSVKSGDEDLFSELDNLDKKKPRSAKVGGGVEKVSVPSKAKPAGGIPSPSGPPPTSRTTPATADSSQNDWQEPKAEDNTSGDSWVKPSQFLKNKEKGTTPSSTLNIPKVQTTETKRQTIPSPQQEPSGRGAGADKGIEEVREWQEPSADDNVTDDDWVKPSEFLSKSKGKQKGKKDKDDPSTRPPPQAPDAEEDDEEKKKGWASW